MRRLSLRTASRVALRLAIATATIAAVAVIGVYAFCALYCDDFDTDGEAVSPKPPMPYTVADVKRAFAASGIGAQLPEGGIGLGWSCEPIGYRAFLEAGWNGYAIVFDREHAAAKWSKCVSRDRSSGWRSARRGNVVVVATAPDAKRAKAALTELR